MDIGAAVFALKAGGKVCRAGWNGKDMWLVLATDGNFTATNMEIGALLPHVVMKTVQDQFIPWLCSQSDLLATDWEEVAS
jgi:hypothetical protein